MATTYQLKTFSDIYTAILEELKIQDTDTVSIQRIKRAINMAYINEIVPYDQWKWLRGTINVIHDAVVNTGTVSVTQSSTSITLSTAPATSKKGHWFSVEGQNERYRIAQHTASSTAVVLDVPYAGETATASSYKIWTDVVPLPTDCREVLKVTHAYQTVPLQAEGLQRFREIVATQPKAEGRPCYTSTGDFVEPAPYAAISGLPALSTRASSGLLKTLVFASTVASYLKVGDRVEISASSSYSYNCEAIIASVSTTTVSYVGTVPLSESATADAALTVKKLGIEANEERYRELLVFPAISTYKTILSIDYIKEPLPLTEDDDEPLMPIGDRIVLFYAGAQWAWASISRNEEAASRNKSLFNDRLMRMVGKMDDSVEMPRLSPSKLYLNSKRQSYRQRDSKFSGDWGGGGGSSSATIFRGTANTVGVFNSSGELGGSTAITTTELGRLDGILSTAAGISDTQTLTNKTIDADSNTITNIENADIKAAAAIAVNKLAATTASRALASDGSGFISASVTTAAELAFVNGVTSAIQTQINTKAPTASPTFTGTITTPLTASRAMVSGASSELAVSAVTTTQLAYLDIAAGRTGTANLVYSANPTFTGTLAAAAITATTLVTSGDATIGGSIISSGYVQPSFVIFTSNGDPGDGGAQVRLGAKATTEGTPARAFHLRSQSAPEAIGTFTQTHRLRVWVNDVEYWLSLDAV